MSKMFTFNGKRMVTWNPQTGCLFNCYNGGCWARKLAEGKLKRHYPNGFVPEFHPDRLKAHFKPDDFVFVSSMGDIAFASNEVMADIFKVIVSHPLTRFLLCTKAPSIYHAPRQVKLLNVYFGATIESNRNDPTITEAHPNTRRYHDMKYLDALRKFLSIEPVMDFDLEIFVDWIRQIKPEIVEVGADNYHNNLPEPPPDKLRALLAELRHFVPNVIEKDGLERLL